MSVLVLHTTESDPGTAQATASYLQSKGYQSHTVFDPSNNEHIRLLPWSQPAKALRNLAGGVETNNRGGVFQVEIVGHAADVPGYSSGWFANLAVYVQRVCAETGTPLVFPCAFVAYPASYGLNAVQRMSNDAWLACAGIVGHQHVPESDHGDPGDMSRLVELLTAIPGEPEVELTDKLLTKDQSVNDTLAWTHENSDRIVKELLPLLAQQIASLSTRLETLQVTGGQVDMDTLATKVADLLAKRLAS